MSRVLCDRVTVVQSHSTKIQIGKELPQRADLLIHEVLSANALTEGVIPSVAHAVRDLLVPSAPLLPERIEVLAALSGDLLAAETSWWSLEGFDLGPLAWLDAAAHGVAGTAPRARMSRPAKLLDIDFRDPDIERDVAYVGAFSATENGLVTGLEQWMDIRFPGGISLGTDDPKSHWGSCYYPFAARRDVEAGEAVGIEVARGNLHMAIGLTPDEQTKSAWKVGL